MGGCAAPKAEPVRVFAAASTRETMEQVAAAFERDNGTSVELNFGPSSDLARQIEHSGAADVFISADESWADYLTERNLVEQRRDLLTNQLVVAVPKESGATIHTLPDLAAPSVQRLALAAPAVPAGRYAREALRKAGVWDQVRDRVLDGGDVRATLTFVARGEAEAGLVYATDVAGNARVRIALSVPADYHTPIRYPAVLVRHEPIKPAARQFYVYLHSAKATAVFRQAGFGIIDND
jgi:molybdate transport system substrate-binding protein